jgi:uncharacterized iron-regulated protein
MDLNSIHSLCIRRVGLLACALGMAFALASCSVTSSNHKSTNTALEPQIIDTLSRGGIVLFAEVHDNRALHAERNRIVASVIAAGARPTFAFEQFDRDSQTKINSLVASGALDAQSLIDVAAPARSTWDWNFYRPLIELALANRLTIIAANLSRSDAMNVATNGLLKTTAFDAPTLQALTLDRPIPDTIRRAQTDEIKRGHCNLLPEEMLPNMADAQFARDATIAHALETQLNASSRGIILFAGNGHVRRDIGVPIWLSKRVPTLSVGMIESATDASAETAQPGRYDLTMTREPEPREDPCIALRKRFGAGR